VVLSDFAENCPLNHINSNLYHYAGNNSVKYVDPDGEAAISMSAIVGITFIGVLAYTAVKNYLNTPEGLQGVQALENALTAGAQVAATVVSKSISVITSKVIETSDDKNRATPIYRTGSGNGTNLTPRTPKDSTGLSYSLIKPETGPYTVTSIEAVNKTGVLRAVKDGPNHVSVLPTDISKMPEWQASREHANENPHQYTKLLQNISLKMED